MTPDMLFQSPWASFTAADLGEAALVPTMLNMEEQSFYVWLTREWARGEGAIVDLGSFAGGSAACLAEGVRQAGRRQTVQGYDKFEVGQFDAFLDRYMRYMSVPPASESPCTPRPLPEFKGTDLLPLAEFFLSPWADGVELHKGQIEEMPWDGPIEILVMDASKTAATMERMSETFFPHLIPGHSIVVQQDFLWWQQPWIAAQMARLSDYFEPVAYVPKHSVSFLCKQGVPLDVLKVLNVVEMSDKEMIAALRDMKQQVKAFKMDFYMRRLISAVKANPGARAAYRFTKRP